MLPFYTFVKKIVMMPFQTENKMPRWFSLIRLALIKMGFLKNDLENFNCLFLKKVWSDDIF